MRASRGRFWLTLAASALLVAAPSAEGAEERSIRTAYATIRYTDDSHVNDFFWRITGRRLAPGLALEEPVKTRVDELVDRVQTLLDMRPDNFRFDIEITTEAGVTGPPARYSDDKKCVFVSPATVTDGILAHEIAHAVICAQFTPPPPEKAQEILARYVDANLWSEY